MVPASGCRSTLASAPLHISRGTDEPQKSAWKVAVRLGNVIGLLGTVIFFGVLLAVVHRGGGESR